MRWEIETWEIPSKFWQLQPYWYHQVFITLPPRMFNYRNDESTSMLLLSFVCWEHPKCTISHLKILGWNLCDHLVTAAQSTPTMQTHDIWQAVEFLYIGLHQSIPEEHGFTESKSVLLLYFKIDTTLNWNSTSFSHETWCFSTDFYLKNVMKLTYEHLRLKIFWWLYLRFPLKGKGLEMEMGIRLGRGRRGERRGELK